ncbi:MAG TPA: C4-type zinc ribbon domain-containing protein [Ktedonobacteraceae bacterium]|jgi:predicted  nucleic acid-binding Zn-ribbon protein|nr:C4-type zinc ribbon domain-containing protein [Ktedonobacteraceae bacterium]
MGTTQIVATLFQLQQLDLEVDRLVAEEQALASSLQNTFPVKKARAEQKNAQQQLANGLKAQKDAEWALEDLERRLKQQEQRLYSGNVTNAKELSALQQEIQHLRAQQGRQEETVLTMMEAAEALRETAEQSARAVSEAERAWDLANAAGIARHEQLGMRLQELRGKRAELASTLDSELVKRYEGMRKTRQGRAVSKVEQNSCQWCRVILTPSELQRVRVSSELQMCSNCGRILYYDR